VEFLFSYSLFCFLTFCFSRTLLNNKTLNSRSLSYIFTLMNQWALHFWTRSGWEIRSRDISCSGQTLRPQNLT